MAHFGASCPGSLHTIGSLVPLGHCRITTIWVSTGVWQITGKQWLEKVTVTDFSTWIWGWLDPGGSCHSDSAKQLRSRGGGRGWEIRKSSLAGSGWASWSTLGTSHSPWCLGVWSCHIAASRSLGLLHGTWRPPERGSQERLGEAADLV